MRITSNSKEVVNFLYEVGILSKTPRSGFFFLGSGNQSVAEHVNRMCYIGYALSMLDGSANTEKIIKMCLFHDLAEARTSDLNYVHQKYTKREDFRAVEDLTSLLPFGDDIKEILDEYESQETREAHLAKDADQLEWIISLKEQVDIGNSRAEGWIPSGIKRLKTKYGKDLAHIIINTNSQEWWFDDPEDDWWVNRGKKINQ